MGEQLSEIEPSRPVALDGRRFAAKTTLVGSCVGVVVSMTVGGPIVQRGALAVSIAAVVSIGLYRTLLVLAAETSDVTVRTPRSGSGANGGQARPTERRQGRG